MEVTKNPPKNIQYINEHGQIMEQGVEYEWLPIKCKTCAGYGHPMADCRKAQNTQWVVKESTTKTETQGMSSEGIQEGVKEKPANQTRFDDGKAQDNLVEPTQPPSEISADSDKGTQATQPWRTLKRIAALAKEGKSLGLAANNSGQRNRKSNKFRVLQEQMVSDKEGGLLETKMKGNKIRRFMEHHFLNWDFYTSSVIEGRLLIIWRKIFAQVNIIEESNQYVHCVVKLDGMQQVFGVTFVYGVNSIEGRRALWEGLQRPALMDKAWLVLGDFNAPFSGQDRSGGKPISDLELVDSVQWLVDTHVEPLRRIGSFFTWTNNQHGAARIYSKIDHALRNEKWIDMFPQSNALFSWEPISDHCSCIVRLQPVLKMGLKLFRFYNYWTEHHEFHDLVIDSWRSPLRATGIKAIFFKMLRLKHCLKVFNRDKIGDLKATYYQAKEAYQEAQLQAQTHPQVFSYQEDERKAAANFSIQEKR
ncbi:uncharacterized protein LOC133832549 [Humulus lupulus]|uniref:uncharacterized protein LOC133832549 n=1 Tax=Humulus lupulus TaxID=3486 RepID=UPI002B40E7CC|nr:uncharacterized protein LOC133832549 [Humulus lupulus]